MPQQVVIIHGGQTFADGEKFLEYLKTCPADLDSFLPHASWRENLAKDLGEGYQVLTPRMPNKQNAKYNEWQIWFERLLPFLTDGVILIGHSLGGVFLVKYLLENKPRLKISKLITVAGLYKAEAWDEFKLPENLSALNDCCEKIIIIQSEDDYVVPASDAKKFAELLPEAELKLFQDRGHFNQATFPELVEVIKE